MFGKTNQVHYFVKESIYLAKLAEFGDNLVVIMFAKNWGNRSEPLYTNYQKSANWFPNVTFFVVDPSTCDKLAMKYAIAKVPTFVFRKKRRDVIRYEGDDVPMLEALVVQCQKTSPVYDVENDVDFEEVMRNVNGQVVVIQFTRKTCERSRLFFPIFQDLANQYPDVAFVKVDVARCPKTAGKYTPANSVPKTVFKLLALEVTLPLKGFDAEQYRINLKAAILAKKGNTDPDAGTCFNRYTGV